MSTMLTQEPSGFVATEPVATAETGGGPIIVASDLSKSADLAMSAARVLSDLTGAPVQVLSVLEPVSDLAPAPLLVGLPPDMDQTRVADRLSELEKKRLIAGGDPSWRMDVRLGDPAPLIARVAKECSARLLVMGLNRHGAMDRVFGGDTVFDVVRLGEAPVLVATEEMKRAPRVVVVGVDFSPLSTAAAQLAVRLFPEATDLYLVYVSPTLDMTAGGRMEATCPPPVTDDFEQLTRSLHGCCARVQTVELTGNRERELARFARGLKADLLVVGSYRRGLFRRLATGTVAARVLRITPCPVLIVPESAVAGELARSGGTAERERMIEIVNGITARNAGRRAVVEVDNRAIGAQALAFDYCFLGMDYDRHCDRVHIYLGEMNDGWQRHITHSVGAPSSVDVLLATDGRDQVVRIADGVGQALVTFW